MSTPRSSHQRCSIKKVFSKISQDSQKNTFARIYFVIDLNFQLCSFIKEETLSQVLSCEISEIFNNTFFTEHLRATASVLQDCGLKSNLSLRDTQIVTF